MGTYSRKYKFAATPDVTLRFRKLTGGKSQLVRHTYMRIQFMYWTIDNYLVKYYMETYAILKVP